MIILPFARNEKAVTINQSYNVLAHFTSLMFYFCSIISAEIFGVNNIWCDNPTYNRGDIYRYLFSDLFKSGKDIGYELGQVRS